MRPEAATIKLWRERPDAMVEQLFKVKPDRWQAKALQAFPNAPRLAMRACAGPGKTAVLAWLAWNFLLTRPHPRMGATSNSGPNLKANLWTELATWRNKSPLLQQQFEQTGSLIYQRENRETWKLEARTWRQDANPQQQADALRGLHGEYVMWLLDESGSYPEAMLPVVENIFSGSPVEAHVVQAGNPTSLDGVLYRACVKARNLWHVVTISGDPLDPDRSPRISLEHAQAQIDQYGRDNPWVMVNILGLFPPASINALIGPDAIEEAMKRQYQQTDIDLAPRVLGVDVARQGLAKSVIFPRQGIVAFPPKIMRNVSSVQGAGQVARTWADWDVDATFVDATGGFGAGWIDQLQLLNRSAIGILFNGDANDKARYYNIRTEMYFKGVEWIKAGGQLPNVPEMVTALSAITYTFKGDRLLLEPKDQVEARIGTGAGLDETDSFALTFAHPVAPRVRGPKLPQREQEPAMGSGYDPFASWLR